MFNRNSGSNEHDILQNQFTSYLSFAVSNARIDFIRAKIARLKKRAGHRSIRTDLCPGQF